MKKMLALVSLLVVGLLVGCGGEKPKAKAPDTTKIMNDMKAATGGFRSSMGARSGSISKISPAGMGSPPPSSSSGMRPRPTGST